MSEALAARRPAVLERWFQAVAASYPGATGSFLGAGGDPFANPVGHTLRDGLARAYDALASDADPAGLAAAVDGMVRVRAVQEFSPSAAVGFVFALRDILREELTGAGLPAPEIDSLGARVDGVALAAFDVYMQCREKIFQIRVREIREKNALVARFGA